MTRAQRWRMGANVVSGRKYIDLRLSRLSRRRCVMSAVIPRFAYILVGCDVAARLRFDRGAMDHSDVVSTRSTRQGYPRHSVVRGSWERRDERVCERH